MAEVIMLNGVVPAEETFARVREAVAPKHTIVLQDLLAYGAEPDSAYGLDAEVGSVLETARTHGWDQFHLLGYSIGASVALAVVAAHRERLRSLVLIEPVWIGNDHWDDAVAAFLGDLDQVMELPPGQRRYAFIAALSAPGAPLPEPPPGPVPAWVVPRTTRQQRIWGAFRAATLDRRRLALFDRPVYLPLGELSHPAFRVTAAELSRVFPRARLKEYRNCSHFDPPHVREPDRVAADLEQLWAQ